MKTSILISFISACLAFSLNAQIHEIVPVRVSETSHNSVKIRGHISGEGISECGICYSTKAKKLNADTYKPKKLNWNGSFKCGINGLQPKTTYYLRAYAVIKDKKYYSKEVKFTTLELKSSIVAGDPETGALEDHEKLW